MRHSLPARGRASMASHPSYPRASTPPPSLPSRTVAPVIEMNISTARSDLQLHEQGVPASEQLATATSEHRPLTQVASYSVTNSTSASVHSSDIRPPPAEQFDGGCQHLPINHEPGETEGCNSPSKAFTAFPHIELLYLHTVSKSTW